MWTDCQLSTNNFKFDQYSIQGDEGESKNSLNAKLVKCFMVIAFTSDVNAMGSNTASF